MQNRTEVLVKRKYSFVENCFYFLFLLSGFWSIFLNDISSSIFQKQLELIDELLPIAILGLAFVTKKKQDFNLNYNWSVTLFALYSIYILLISLTEISNHMYLGGYVFLFKIFTFFVLLLISASFEKWTGRPYECFIRFLIKSGVVYVIFNVTFYFIPLPIWDADRSRLFVNTIGRITCGYAPVDAVILSFLVMAILYKDFGFSKFKRTLISIILIIDIIIMASATGIIALGAVLLIYFIMKLNSVRRIKVLFIAIALIAVIVNLIIPRIKYNNELAGSLDILTNRWYAVTDPNKVTYNTLEIRNLQYKMAKAKYVRTDFDDLFGIGYGKYTNKIVYVGHGTIFIENQYDSLSVAYGKFGLLLYIIMLFSWCWKCKYKAKSAYIYLTSIIILSINSFSATPLYGFQEAVIFSIFMSYSRIEQKRNI